MVNPDILKANGKNASNPTVNIQLVTVTVQLINLNLNDCKHIFLLILIDFTINDP